MHNHDLELIYESEILNEGILDDVVDKVNKGLKRGLSIYDTVAEISLKNIPQFIAIVGIFSSFVTMQRVKEMYDKNPEKIEQHNAIKDAAIDQIVKGLQHLKSVKQSNN